MSDCLDTLDTLDLISRQLANLDLDSDTTLSVILHESKTATHFLLNKEALGIFCTKLDENSDRLLAAKNSGGFNLRNPAVKQYQKIEHGYTGGKESLHAILSQLVFDVLNGRANLVSQLQVAILAWKNKLDGFLSKWKEDVEELSKHEAGFTPCSFQSPQAPRSVSQQSHGRANSSSDNGRWSGSTKCPSTSLSGLLTKPNGATLQSLLTAYDDKTLRPEDLIKAFGKSAIINEDPDELYAADDVPAPLRNAADQVPINGHHRGAAVPDNPRGSTLSSSAPKEGLAGAHRYPAADSQLRPTGGQGTPNSPPAPAVQYGWFIRKAFKINAIFAMALIINCGIVILVTVAALLPTEGSGHWDNLELRSDRPFALAINTLFAFGSLYALLFEVLGRRRTRRARNNTERSRCVRLCARISYLGTFCTLSIISVIGCWVLWVVARHTNAEVFFKALAIVDIASKQLFILTLIFFLLELIKLETKTKARAVQEDQELTALVHNRAAPGTSDMV